MAGVTLSVSDAPSAADIKVVEAALVAHNAACAPPTTGPLCVFARDDTGRTVGGATGYTDWSWLFVDCFWVPAPLRKAGLGGGILRGMEGGEALARGCRRSRLYTDSFQAEGFYKKHGCAVFGVLEDFPPGHRQVWMRKDLAS